MCANPIRRITLNIWGGDGGATLLDRRWWNAYHRGGGKSARERMDDAVVNDAKCESTPQSELVLPCDGQIRELTWGAATVRRNAAIHAPGVGQHPVGSGVVYEHGNMGNVAGSVLTREKVIPFIRRHDKDLWVRMNAWAGNWRRGVEDAFPSRIGAGSVSANRRSMRPPVVHTSVETLGDPGNKLITKSIRRDCDRDNMKVLSHQSHQLKEHYGSYLPQNEGTGCDGDDQVRCKQSICTLEQIVSQVETWNGRIHRRRVDNPGGFHVSREEGGNWMTKAPSDSWLFHGRERKLSLCVKAKFRCKLDMVILPPLKFPWDPDSGLPKPGTAVPATLPVVPDPVPPGQNSAASEGGLRTRVTAEERD